MRFAVVLSLVLVFAASGAAPALAGRNFVVGVNEDAVKWRPGISSVSTDLGLGYYRVTQGWQPGQTQPSDSDAASINEAVKNAGSQKILLSVFGSASAAPVGAASRAQYCSFVSSVLDRFPQIAAVNIWNEANLSYFWKPQFNRNGSSAAPAAYEALLARCYDQVGRHPSVRMLTSLSPRGNDNPHAVSNISHSVKNFVAKLGQSYRRSHRRARIFDGWAERLRLELERAPLGAAPPRHRRGRLSAAAFLPEERLQRHTPAGSRPEGRAHLVPGGWLPDRLPTKRSFYQNSETDRSVVAPVGGKVDQASQLSDAIRLAYCQPAVGGFFNFLLADESNLHGWQSGILFSDWTPKPSYQAFKRVIAEVNSHRVDCAKLKARIKKLGGSPAVLAP